MSFKCPRPLGLLLTASATLLGFASAEAQGSAVPFHVDYRGPPGCARAATFVDRLIGRSPHLRQASANEVAPKLIVRITRAGRSVRGHLVIDDVDGHESERDVEGDTCESVQGALVLVSLLAIDPTAVAPASTQATPGDAGAGANPASTSGGPAALGPGDSGEVPAAEASAPHVVADAAPAPSSAPTAAETGPAGPPLDVRPGWHIGAGAGALAESGAAPGFMLGVPIFLELGRGSDSLLSPSLRAGFEYANSGAQAVPGGGVRMVQSLAVLDLCPVRLAWQSLRLIPCVHGEAGVVNAAGLDITPARADSRPWIAVGPLARARYLAASPFFFELSAGLNLPLQRDRFFFEPDNTVFHAPVVSGFAGAAVGVTIL